MCFRLYVAQAGLRFTVLLPPPTKCWDYGHVPPSLDFSKLCIVGSEYDFIRGSEGKDIPLSLSLRLDSIKMYLVSTAPSRPNAGGHVCI